MTFDRAEATGAESAIAYGRVRASGRDGTRSVESPLIWVADLRDGLILGGRFFTDPDEARRRVDAR